jgi:hypothetical protein
VSTVVDSQEAVEEEEDWVYDPAWAYWNELVARASTLESGDGIEGVADGVSSDLEIVIAHVEEAMDALYRAYDWFEFEDDGWDGGRNVWHLTPTREGPYEPIDVYFHSIEPPKLCIYPGIPHDVLGTMVSAHPLFVAMLPGVRPIDSPPTLRPKGELTTEHQRIREERALCTQDHPRAPEMQVVADLLRTAFPDDSVIVTCDGFYLEHMQPSVELRLEGRTALFVDFKDYLPAWLHPITECSPEVLQRAKSALGELVES